MTLPDLAGRAGIGVATLSRYERQRATGRISHEYLQRLSDALEVDFSYLTSEALGPPGASAGEISAREALTRFIADHDDLSTRTQRRLRKVQDDYAAPKTSGQWVDFWRLARILAGDESPIREAPTSSRPNVVKKRILKIVPVAETPKTQETSDEALRHASGRCRARSRSVA